MKRMLVPLLAAGVLTAALTAAGTPSSSPAGTTSSTSSAPFIEAISLNPDSLTPAMGEYAVDNQATVLMDIGLIYLNTKDQWTPGIATSWSASNNGLTYTFHLNPKAKWSDGVPLTSADVVYTWHYMTNPNLHILSNVGWNYVKSVVAEGPHTVVFHLTQPYAPFYSTVGGSAIVPQHIFDKWTPTQINHDIYSQNTPVVDGPYVLTSWKQDQSLTFKPNRNWWGPKVHIKKIIIDVVPNQNTQFNMLATGNLTVSSIPPQDASQVSSLRSQFNITNAIQPTYALVQLDENNFLKDVKVRQALNYATPKLQIVKSIEHNMAVPAYGDQVPGGYWYDPNVPHAGFSLTKAAAILKQDGFTKGPNGYLQKNGQELTVPIWTNPTVQDFADIAQVLSKDWEQIGVYAPVQSAGWSVIFGNGTPQNPGPQVNGKDEALIFGWGQGVFPDNTIDFNSKYVPKSPYQPSPQENGERYVNPLMDKLQAEGVTLSSRAARKKVYDQIQMLEAQTLPLIFLFWYKGDTAVSKNLTGYQTTTFSTTMPWTWAWKN